MPSNQLKLQRPYSLVKLKIYLNLEPSNGLIASGCHKMKQWHIKKSIKEFSITRIWNSKSIKLSYEGWITTGLAEIRVGLRIKIMDKYLDGFSHFL